MYVIDNDAIDAKNDVTTFIARRRVDRATIALIDASSSFENYVERRNARTREISNAIENARRAIA